MNQFSYFLSDINSSLGKNKWRILTLLFTKQFYGLFSYRLDRQLYLLTGWKYKFLRIPLSPFYFVLQIFSNIDIHNEADINRGISIWHTAGGIVISGKSIIGKNLVLTGGNFIGIRKPIQHGELIIGDNFFLGANSVVLGPIVIANSIKVAALSCVVHSCLIDGVTLVGSPAKVSNKPLANL